MSVRRALVDGAVLSLQDSCVFYPCCKSCFSRVDTEQLDSATRCRCSRCGSRCLGDQVDYRYRLSLRVTRDSCVFDVTVFGNSLNVFFGIHATGLQKLVVNQDGPVEPSTKSRLLMKAVRDCFIGRHFIFGIKLTGTESGPWFGGPDSNDPSSRETAQFVASQMILPKASGLSGCTVLSYYQALLQKASEYEEGSADPAAPLLLDPGTSSSFSTAPPWASGLLSQSQLRPQNLDLSLTPTPPWEQSLGVVTSSAEQEEEEEGCSAQDGGHAENSKTPLCELEKHKVAEERTSLLRSEQSLNNSPFVGYPNLYFGATVGNSFSVNSCFSPFQPVRKRYSVPQKESSTSQLTRSVLSSSSAWEDLPFSESLTEFLHKQDNDFEALGEIKPSLNVQNEKQTARTYLESTNPAVRLTSARQRNTRVRRSRSFTLSDISNTPAPGGGDRPDPSIQEHDGPEDENVNSHERVSENDKSFSTREEKEEQLEEDSYNCSADLFSDENTDAESVRSTARTCLSEQQRPRAESDTQLTPQKQLQISKCSKRDSLALHGAEHLDFVPPSQSTPVVKPSAVTRSLSASRRNVTGEISIKMLAWSRRSNRSASGRRFRKSEEHKNQLQGGQDESTRAADHERDSRVGHVTVCDLEDDEGVVAPTPDGKTQRAASRRRRRTASSSSDLGLIRKTYRIREQLITSGTPESDM
ncbi:DNA damage-induced apoptosis suppressor protein [Austrofundulus limnaeus]|uniref:DNA damage-induced apoptosis suppressor protein n=1 Tax=Austrofundulus limnaeus TaxID=52670 RepID=A0A2I4CKG5_AUSLI|nr:PREDICTED: DNA damage-induced apoptosis suppressor protein [Austrofundulus limnaeus]